MSCFSCSLCIVTKNISNSNEQQHSSSHSHTQPKTINNNTYSLKPHIMISSSSSSKKPRRPSVIEIEHAIGTGRFRDTNPWDLEDQKDIKFDMETMSFPERFEVPIQKKLRKTSKWLVQRTEKKFRMSSKMIFKVTFLWLLPIWGLSILVASGAIDIPFINQFLDQ